MKLQQFIQKNKTISYQQIKDKELANHIQQILAWHGQQMPSLIELVRLYLRRFAIEHWYRFAKQRRHWTLPHLGTQEQCDRLCDLMPMMTWELWLAREMMIDCPLPWQKPQVNLTPGRVAQGFGAVIAMIGTPTCSPKPRRKTETK